MERLDKKRIIELITEQRRSRDLSFDDMGNILHVSGRTVRRWERGEQTPTIDDVINLCNEFGISFDLDEPDDDITYALESKEQLYRVISETIATLK